MVIDTKKPILHPKCLKLSLIFKQVVKAISKKPATIRISHAMQYILSGKVTTKVIQKKEEK